MKNKLPLTMQKNPKKRVEITDIYRKNLKKERVRTGLGSIALLRNRADIPRGLNAAIINTWFMGTVKQANPEFLDYVLAAYKASSSGNPDTIHKKFIHHNRRSQNKDFCKIDSALIDFHRNRTQLSILPVISVMKGEFKTISDKQIKAIFYTQNRTAYRPYYLRVLEILKLAPDVLTLNVAAINSGDRDEYIPLTPELLGRLEKYRSEKLLPSKIFKYVPFHRDNPRASNVNTWLNGRCKTVRKFDIEFILQHCEAFLRDSTPIKSVSAMHGRED